MRIHRIGGGLALTLVLGACQFSVSTNPNGPRAGRPAPAPVANNNPAPAPAPAPPPSPVVTGTSAQPLSGPANPPTPPATPPTGPRKIIRLTTLGLDADVAGLRKPTSAALRTRIKSVRLIRPAAVQNTTPQAVRNMDEVLKIRQRPKSVCGLVEVAPNRIVSIDCQPYTKPTKVKMVNAKRFLTLMKQHRLRLDHTDVGGAGGVGNPSSEGNHPSAEGGGDEIPTEIDFRKNGTVGPIRDQDQVGACTAFSLAAAMDNGIRRLNKGEVMSAMHLWSHYGYPNMNNAADSNKDRPIAEDAFWKYDAPLACRMYKGNSVFSCSRSYKNVKENSVTGDAAVDAKIREADSAGKYKVTAFELLENDGDTLVAALARGNAIWVAVQINSEFFSNDRMDRGAVIRRWTTPTSGHAMAIVGYRKVANDRQFLLQNSWAEDWGDKGYAWVPESALIGDKRLTMALTVKVEPKDPPAPPPPPPPPPQASDDGKCQAGFAKDARDPSDTTCYKSCTGNGAGQCNGFSECEANVCLPSYRPDNNPDVPTDDDCSWDELVDSVSFKCATICPDDTRPANGCATDSTKKK
jgi:C1A family cysteine protease